MSKIDIKDNLHNYLVVLLLFTITIKASISFVIAFLILILWLLKGDLKDRLKTIINDKLSQTFLALFAIHLAGVFWSQDLHDALKILSKQKTYLFAPLIISFFDRRFAKYALKAFLFAIFISEIYSIYLYQKFGVQREGSLPSPFMHHMHYSLILAFSFGYIVDLINFKEIKKPINLLYLSFATLTFITLFINKGRIGQVAIFVVLLILAIRKFKLSAFKSIAITTMLFITIIFGAYHISDNFKARIDRGYNEYTKVLGSGKRDSIICRFEFWQYATDLGNQNPIIGIGTGDSIQEMNNLLGEKFFKQLFFDCGLGMKYQFNPHNNFLLYYMQFGFLGVFILLFVLFRQFKIAYEINSTPMFLLLSVTLIGMFSTSLISMHIKYIFFYAFVLTMLYLDKISNSSIK